MRAALWLQHAEAVPLALPRWHSAQPGDQAHWLLHGDWQAPSPSSLCDYYEPTSKWPTGCVTGTRRPAGAWARGEIANNAKHTLGACAQWQEQVSSGSSLCFGMCSDSESGSGAPLGLLAALHHMLHHGLHASHGSGHGTGREAVNGASDAGTRSTVLRTVTGGHWHRP